MCDDSEGSVFGRLISGDQAAGRTRSPAAVKIQVHKTTIKHVNSEQAQPKGIMDRTFYFIITVPENNINKVSTGYSVVPSKLVSYLNCNEDF